MRREPYTSAGLWKSVNIQDARETERRDWKQCWSEKVVEALRPINMVGTTRKNENTKNSKSMDLVPRMSHKRAHMSADSSDKIENG